MAYDFKKEFKEFYLPPKKPAITLIPQMNFLAVSGSGDPNEVDGEYQHALQLLYPICYTLKMSYKGTYKIKGFFEYVVPPLEGFWWQDGIYGMDYSRKDLFRWISLIRLPDFISEVDVQWAREAAAQKKKMDFSAVEYFTYQEGLCVQCMHIGAYDTEPATVALMEQYAGSLGYEQDFSTNRYHHEIYLGDPRKCSEEKRKTVIRHPVKKSDKC